MKKHIIILSKFCLLTICSLMLSSHANAAADPEKGKALSVTCAACHGPNGTSPAPTFPNIAGQYADYLAYAIKAYQTGDRQNPIMAPMVASLSEQDIADLAAFYSAQEGLSVVKKPN